MEPGRLIVAIDGPAGAGKTTLAKALAAKLGWTYLDTGAMYRAVGLAAGEAGVDPADENGLSRILAGLKLRIAPGRETTRVFIGDREITAEIRQPHVSALASAASALGVVRQAMVEVQRHLGAAGRVVAEGRDMGTVVFPEAAVKFFLFADLKVRAERRCLELQGMGSQATITEVTEAMAERDQADSTRELAPLRAAPDAVRIDSTALSPEEILEVMLETVRQKTGIRPENC